MIKDFTPRLYQETILATAASYNTLVVLPTGLGKTNIFLMLAAQRLRQHPGSKILFVGPTRPLIDQYKRVFLEHFDLPEERLAVFTGMVAPAKRKELWKAATIIFSTPQGLENDIINRNIMLEDVSLLGVDEAHRAVGEYSYGWIAKQYVKRAHYPRVLGLTASPGSDLEKITEVCQNLCIEKVEVRTESDPDVKPYVQDMDVEYVTVDLTPQLLEVSSLLKACMRSKLAEVQKYGFLRSSVGVNKRELLQLQGSLHGLLAQGNKDFPVLKSISLLAEATKAQHALELAESQGVAALHNYFSKLQAEAKTARSKAVKNLVADTDFKAAWVKTEKLHADGVEHPKLGALVALVLAEVQRDAGAKLIVFTQYRDTGLKIRETLNEVDAIHAQLFVGQMKKGATGMSQKKQKEMLDRFRAGGFNVLVATSIGEEGLDIPQVDTVVFYEPVPSAIRQIQRRGRAGRQERGRAVILLARNTRDEAYRWVAHHKEKRMHRILHDLKRKLTLEKQSSLGSYAAQEQPLKIFADVREKGSGVIRELIEQGVDVELKTLQVGDYLCSSRVAVEFKTVQDFVNSIVDKRLLQQLRALKLSFERPVIVMEGGEDLYAVRNIHPNAVRGMLATIVTGYGIPLLHTRNYRETAALLIAIAKREQLETGEEFSMRGERKPLTQRALQEYIVSALPGVEVTMAKKLLLALGSVGAVMAASEESLKKVPLIGEKKAAAIRRVLDKTYDAKDT